jgi:hypothetical protein
MSEIYIFDDGYIAVGKPQLLHHAYVYFPPTPEATKTQYASDINRIIRIERRLKDPSSGRISTITLPMEYRNYELTAGDINKYNKPVSELDNERRNQHRYLTEKEIANNAPSYSTEGERMTWDKVHEEYWLKTRTYKTNKGALYKALLASPRNRFSTMTFPQLVEERKKAIRERNVLKFKGVSAWRNKNAKLPHVGPEGMELSKADRYRFHELNGIIRLLDEKLGLNIAS